MAGNHAQSDKVGNNEEDNGSWISKEMEDDDDAEYENPNGALGEM